MPDYRYTTPHEGAPSEAVPTEFDDEDTALIATNPDHRGPEDVPLFSRADGTTPGPLLDVDTDKIEAFPEAAHMIAEAERAAKWDVVGRCHDAMTQAGIPLAKASEIMAVVVAGVGLVNSPNGRGPNGTMRPTIHGNAPHGTIGLPVPKAGPPPLPNREK